VTQPLKPKRKAIWHPVQLNTDAAYALQAMSRGEATDHQQKFVLDWLITDTCQTYEEPFTPDSVRVTDYVLGRRSVGLGIVKHLTISPAKLAGNKAETE